MDSRDALFQGFFFQGFFFQVMEGFEVDFQTENGNNQMTWVSRMDFFVLFYKDSVAGRRKWVEVGGSGWKRRRRRKGS